MFRSWFRVIVTAVHLTACSALFRLDTFLDLGVFAV